ncbi:unnamed protein product [Rotaria sp. Silwood1]|nr:unnamed protein product [Rotaria sp. Silwood1]
MFTFYFPALRYIHVNKIPLILAIQILDRCRQIRTFSAELYYDEDVHSSSTTYILSPLFCSLMPPSHTVRSGRTQPMTVSKNSYIGALEPLCRTHTGNVPPVVRLVARAKRGAIYILTQTNRGTARRSWIRLDPNNMRLTAMIKVDLKINYPFESEKDKYLEKLLPCCPNLHTFFTYVNCDWNQQTLLDANWWTHVLTSNKKLQRMSLQLHWSTRDYDSDQDERTVQNFRSLTYFTQLKANVTSEFDDDFPWFLFDVIIKN